MSPRSGLGCCVRRVACRPCDAHGVEPACDDIFGLQVGAVGGADGGCGGAELCGTHTEVCSEAGTEASSLLGTSVNAEEETSFSGDTENGHGGGRRRCG